MGKIGKKLLKELIEAYQSKAQEDKMIAEEWDNVSLPW